MGDHLWTGIPSRYVTEPTRSTQPCITPGSLNRVSALIGWCEGGNVTSARWQVTLSDPIWHVSLCSGEACCELLYPFTLLYFSLHSWSKSVHFCHALGYRRCIWCGTVQVLWAIPSADWPAGPRERQPAMSDRVGYQPQCDGGIRGCATAHALLCQALVRDLHVGECWPALRRHAVFDVAVYRLRWRTSAGRTQFSQQLAYSPVPLQLLHAGDLIWFGIILISSDAF